MKWNMGSADWAIKFGIAILIGVLYFTNVITGIWATVLLLVMGILLLSTFIGSCPLYYPFGISTKKKPGH